MHARHFTSIAILLVAVFAAGILFATTGANLFGSGDRVGAASVAKDVQTVVQRLELEQAFIDVAAQVGPSVVQIHSERVVDQLPADTPFGRFFFNLPESSPHVRTGLGSGVIVRSDGYIITNHHVIDQADELEIRLADGRFLDGEVIGTDAKSDLAVIRVDAEDLPVVPYGSIDDVRVGQWVLAFGSPLSEDLDNTVTAGIVSALQRSSSGLSSLNNVASFIQTDAAINPGNSGGPLVDLRGNLVGINSAIYSPTGVNLGIGFAIPVDVVDNVISQLIDTGEVERGFLGVEFGSVPQSLAEALDVSRGAAQVARIVPGSAAEEAGLQEGDIITGINGTPLTDAYQLPATIGNMLPNDRITLDIVRGKERLSPTLTLGRWRDDLAEKSRAEDAEAQDEKSLEEVGITLGDITPAMLQRLGLKKTEDVRGVMITSIGRNSAAYREAELRSNDIIVEMDRAAISGLQDFQRTWRELESGESVFLKVLRPRDGTTRPFFTAITKP